MEGGRKNKWQGVTTKHIVSVDARGLPIDSDSNYEWRRLCQLRIIATGSAESWGLRLFWQWTGCVSAQALLPVVEDDHWSGRAGVFHPQNPLRALPDGVSFGWATTADDVKQWSGGGDLEVIGRGRDTDPGERAAWVCIKNTRSVFGPARGAAARG